MAVLSPTSPGTSAKATLVSYPITDERDEKRKLFFWYFPSYSPEPRDDIVVWRMQSIGVYVSLTIANSPQ